MQPPQQHSWINLAELKNQIIRKLGPERSKQYFDYLNRFLNLKLSKVEFDKLCLRTIGGDGIPLHNQLIHSILKNACTANDNPLRQSGNKKPSDGVYHQNGSISVVTQASSPLALPNGDILSPSLRKARTGARERRGGDRRSALGPNGKTNYSSPSSSIPHSEDFNTALENGNSSSPDTRRPLQQHQELNQQTENADENSIHHSAKLAASTVVQSSDGFLALHSKRESGSLGRKDGKGVSGRIPLHAPLGIPYCPVSIGGSRPTIPLASSSKTVGVCDTNGLLDTINLRARMDPIAATHSLQGVSVDCANALNNGLDTYLKGLIRSCSELNGSRSDHVPFKNNPNHFRPINGVTPGHHYQMQSSSWPLDTPQENEPKRPISLLDFRVAMELNPQQLGEDWPVLLEKICTRAFEE